VGVAEPGLDKGIWSGIHDACSHVGRVRYGRGEGTELQGTQVECVAVPTAAVSVGGRASTADKWGSIGSRGRGTYAPGGEAFSVATNGDRPVRYQDVCREQGRRATLWTEGQTLLGSGSSVS
jgi:hypothetical protein